MELLKNYIYRQVANHSLTQAEAKQMLIELKDKDRGQEDEIAIIGMAGIFPKARNLEEYWSNIKNGVIGIDELPQVRVKDIEDFLLRIHYRQLEEENAIKEDGHLDLKYETRGYLEEIDKFDLSFFGIPPREAKSMDPDQRKFLEIAYEAIEDAGYGGNKIYGTNTGVFVGIDHVSDMKYKQLAAAEPMVVTGTWPGILASRVSYIYNLHGPSIVTDTACSSGMVSVHTACNSLKNGECEMAIAGGLSSFYYRPMKFKSELKELDSVESKDNIVRTFDKNANGTVWGEGVGAVFLKPLSKALADGDSIHAVIKASAINNDGASNGITAPDAGAQERLLLSIWEKAKINPETIQYIEAHGTGTVLGDPIEIKAMTNAFRYYTDKKQFCGVGSVKTSIGHLVGASGLASLLKVILMLKNKTIPASLNFKEPNQFINFGDSPVYVTDSLREWERGEAPRRAGINAFGFSGTNCHVILEEAPSREDKAEAKTNEFEIFTVSAKNRNVLEEAIRRCCSKFLSEEIKLQGVCYTANTGRGHYTHRLILLVKDSNDLNEKLKYVIDTGLDDLNKFGVYYGEHKIVPGNKTTREKGDISEGERRKFSKAAEIKLEELAGSYNYPAAAELCELYIKGATVEWENLYKGQNRKKANIPVYPLERTRCWYEENKPDLKLLRSTSAKKSKEIAHPLVDRCLAESFYQDIYATDFSSDRHWVLSDHKILGSHVIPGTTYIEMVVEICKKYYGSELELRNIIYYAPVVVDEHEVREVQAILDKQKDHIEVTIASRINAGDIDEQWVKHAECKVYKLETVERKSFVIDDITAKLQSQKDVEKLIDRSNRPSGAAQLGARWQNSKTIAVGRNEALIELELPQQIAGDQDQYNLHVSMLDNAVNAISQDIGKGLYLPFLYKSLKVYGRMPHKFYSYIRINESLLKGMETITFDVSMMDCEGMVFAEATDYSIKKVNETEFNAKGAGSKNNVFFEMGWISSSLSGNEKSPLNGDILVFKDKKCIGDEIIKRLQAEGRRIIEAEAGSKFRMLGTDNYEVGGDESDYQSLMGALSDRDISQIIHIMTVTGNDTINDLKGFEEHQKLGVYSLFNLTRALVANKFKRELDIVIIADHANEITKEEEILKPMNSALFGIAKVIGLEHSNLKCRCIDIDSDIKTENLISELKTADKTFKAAYRKGVRYVEEFRKHELIEDTDNKISIRENGLYIITGGTGGLGLEMGKYLASKNKVRIAFINRSSFPERKLWDQMLENVENKKLQRAIAAIREMEQNGSEVCCLKANVADMEEMEKAVGYLRSAYGAVNGVIHCAGVAGDGFIIRKTKAVFDSVLAPKMQGTWIIDKVTDGEKLDFFVMFTSILTVFGDPGQSDYTAANSYMDTYAAYRNRKGKKTFAINWPAWKDAGMAVDYGIQESDTTVKPITTEKAIRSLEEVLNSRSYRVLPGELNYSKIINIKDELTFRLSEQLEDILKKHKKRMDISAENQGQPIENVKIVIKGRGEEAYNETESKMAQIWSQVLGFDEIDIFDSFSSLGGDSLLAIQLLKQVNKVFGDVIDISDVFSYPSVQQMADYVDEKLGNKKGEKKNAPENEEKLFNENLKNLLDGLESNQTSIEDALKILGS